MKGFKIGIGYDIHALEQGSGIVLGGVAIPLEKTFRAHSDGDVLLHAICDAILGALGKDDLGTLFPDTDPSNSGKQSGFFLRKVQEAMLGEGYDIGNLDCVLVAESPKISSLKSEIISSISGIMGVSPGKINIKGKTAEKMGPVGEGRAIEAHAVVLLEKK